MTVTVRLIGVFRIDRFKERTLEFSADVQISAIIELLGISDRAVGTVLINGVHAKKSDTLSDGDVLAILPILGGG